MKTVPFALFLVISVPLVAQSDKPQLDALRQASTLATASDLIHFCESDAIALKMLCTGYISGVAAFLRESKELGLGGFFQTTMCLEEGITRAQLIKVFLRYTEKNPQQLHWPPATVISFALQEAFPCSE